MKQISALSYLFLLGLTICHGNLSIAQFPPMPDDGRCYGRCGNQKRFDVCSETFFVYLGDEKREKVDLEILQIGIDGNTTEWVREKVDRKSSPNGQAYFKWSIVKNEAPWKTIKILKDTTQSDNFEVRRYEHKILQQANGWPDWIPIVCESDISEKLVQDVQYALKMKGYLNGEISSVYCNNTRAALARFQRDYNLYVGLLDFESLEKLGVALE